MDYNMNDNTNQNTQQVTPQVAPQQVQPRPTTIMVTPYMDPMDDNHNPTAKKLCIAAVICLVATKFVPTFSLVLGAIGEMFDTHIYFPSFNILLIIAAIVMLIIVRVMYPKNSLSKGLLIGYLANFIMSIVLVGVVFILVVLIMDGFTFVGFSDLIYEIMEIFEEFM
ncbi:hypothetical protein [Butyrivibrio sp. VCB2006]|uniref:hypothetical protein n=1 Tax=Butyrivibrio sp. VCB2006 TaxID=1280679 RepID=UPI00040228D7|nr:hypothetical protein [Butyrivibrio sp. VCB2006]